MNLRAQSPWLLGRSVSGAFATGLAAVFALSVAVPVALAQDRGVGTVSGSVTAPVLPAVDQEGERPLLEGWPELLIDPENFDGERLSDEARRAVEQFLAAVEPMMDQLSLLIRDLPRYEAPVILPNGDILIRRQRPAPYGDLAPEFDPEADPGGRANPDGSLDL